jgi:hypothetical protein
MRLILVGKSSQMALLQDKTAECLRTGERNLDRYPGISLTRCVPDDRLAAIVRAFLQALSCPPPVDDHRTCLGEIRERLGFPML